jgi:hypothetical protein
MIANALWSDRHICINKIIKFKFKIFAPFLILMFINTASYLKYLSLTIRW